MLEENVCKGDGGNCNFWIMWNVLTGVRDSTGCEKYFVIKLYQSFSEIFRRMCSF